MRGDLRKLHLCTGQIFVFEIRVTCYIPMTSFSRTSAALLVRLAPAPVNSLSANKTCVYKQLTVSLGKQRCENDVNNDGPRRGGRYYSKCTHLLQGDSVGIYSFQCRRRGHVLVALFTLSSLYHMTPRKKLRCLSDP